MQINFRAEFDIPREVCYLNAAYMTPQPRAVLEAATLGATLRSTPWKITPDDFFSDIEALRAVFAGLISCSADNIAVVPSTGYGVSCAAANLALHDDGIILGMHEQFPSNYYAWQRHAQSSGSSFHRVQKEDGQSWADAFLRDIERLGNRISVATLEMHHWATAELIDLDVVIPALRSVGARVVLDLTQSIGACPIDIERLKPDFMATATYKWQFCPYGIAFLYVDDQYFDGVPIEEPWMDRDNATDFSRLAEVTDYYQVGARRFDMSGKSSFSNVAAALAAQKKIEEWGIAEISERIATTNLRIAEILSQHGFETAATDTRAPHFQGARLPAADPRELATRLIENGVYASVRGDYLRVAPHVYTDDADLARFDAVLGASLK